MLLLFSVLLRVVTLHFHRELPTIMHGLFYQNYSNTRLYCDTCIFTPHPMGIEWVGLVWLLQLTNRFYVAMCLFSNKSHQNLLRASVTHWPNGSSAALFVLAKKLLLT